MLGAHSDILKRVHVQDTAREEVESGGASAQRSAYLRGASQYRRGPSRAPRTWLRRVSVGQSCSFAFSNCPCLCPPASVPADADDGWERALQHSQSAIGHRSRVPEWLSSTWVLLNADNTHRDRQKRHGRRDRNTGNKDGKQGREHGEARGKRRWTGDRRQRDGGEEGLCYCSYCVCASVQAAPCASVQMCSDVDGWRLTVPGVDDGGDCV